MTPDDSIVIQAVLGGMTLVTLATFKMVWGLRDDVRDLTKTVTDPRNGVTTTLDRLVNAFDGLGNRVVSLEAWREAQSEGEEG